MPKGIRGFVKGQSGNPGGRPKRPWTFMGLYEEELENVLTAKDGSRIEAKKAVARKLVQMAIAGDIQAIKELANRLDGMPKQSTDLTSDGEKIEGLVIVKDADKT